LWLKFDNILSLTQCRPEESQGGGERTQERKKPRPKDVFGRALPTEEEFEVLKNAPRYAIFFFTLSNMLIVKCSSVIVKFCNMQMKMKAQEKQN